MHSPEHYSITTRLVDVDGEKFYEASVRELPDLRVYEEDPATAYASALDAISAAAALARELGKEFPTPAPVIDEEEEASGRITLRLPRQLHTRMARAAAEDEVSLNIYLVAALSNFDGFRSGHRSALKEISGHLSNRAVANYYTEFTHQSPKADLERWDQGFAGAFNVLIPPSVRKTLNG